MTALLRLVCLTAALVLCAALPAFLSGPAAAQEPAAGTAPATQQAIDYEAWTAVAGRAEEAISAGRASNEAFEALRAEIVGWRERFLRAQSVNAARIETLQDQIAALGPAPEEGATESEEIAARRAELNAQLAEARAPVTRAEEAFRRADGLAREIDGLIRERQADALLSLGPTPLNPLLWGPALADLTGSLRATWGEFTEAWRIETKREALREGLVMTVALSFLALALILFGFSAMGRAARHAAIRAPERARYLTGLVVSLGQVAAPWLGFVLLAEILQSTGIAGLRAQQIADLLPIFGLSLFGAMWLGQRLFPQDPAIYTPVAATPEQSRSMRRAILFIGIFVGLTLIMGNLIEVEEFSEGTAAVLLFPIAAMVGLGLIRVGGVLRQIGRSMTDEDVRFYGARGLGFVGQIAALLGVAGIVMAAVGYLNAAFFMLVPTALSLGLLGIMLLLIEPIRDLYAVVARTDAETARAALIPTLFNFLVVLASIPLFALIWGARTADLTELWAKFREGFTVGETRISPENFLTFVLVFTAFYIATRMIQGALRTSVLPKTRIDPGGQTAILSGLGYFGIFLAAVIAITTAGIDLSSLAIVAGALSVGIGFGLQNIVQNFVAGIILLIERPVSEGDWIEVGGHTGIVRGISVRSTRIETFDRTDVIVPNGDFVSGSVINWTRGNVVGRVTVPVGVAYGTDTRKVERILREIAEDHPLVAVDPPPGIDFIDFGASSLDFQIRAVIRDINFGMAVRTELRHQIAERFAAEGIEIPFAQQDIWLRNPEALRPAPPRPDSFDGDDDAEAEAEGDAAPPAPPPPPPTESE